MRAGASAALLLLAACATSPGGAIDPELVGRYEKWGIDTGSFLELAADGTWIEGDLGFMASFSRWCGRWHVVDRQLVLELVYIGGRDEPTLRMPPGEAAARCYPKRFAVIGEGAATELKQLGERFPPWTRVVRPPSRR